MTRRSGPDAELRVGLPREVPSSVTADAICRNPVAPRRGSRRLARTHVRGAPTVRDRESVSVHLLNGNRCRFIISSGRSGESGSAVGAVGSGQVRRGDLRSGRRRVRSRRPGPGAAGGAEAGWSGRGGWRGPGPFVDPLCAGRGATRASSGMTRPSGSGGMSVSWSPASWSLLASAVGMIEARRLPGLRPGGVPVSARDFDVE